MGALAETSALVVAGGTLEVTGEQLYGQWILEALVFVGAAALVAETRCTPGRLVGFLVDAASGAGRSRGR